MAVPEIAELAPDFVGREADVQIIEDAKDDFLADAHRTAGVENAEDAPARFLALLLLEIDSPSDI
ncbi:MAG TPA: hypothetical protein VMF50_17365 [Candidatus Binataceae bacterium]|nr:hypothetical protein [Candidatus Binataceae bacterium]